MTAVRYDLSIEQGATYTVVFEWRENDGSSPPSGTLIDTIGYTPTMQIRTRPGGTLLAALESGIELVADEGVITVRIGADVTAALPNGGVYDLELHSDSDPTEVVRLAEGRVFLSTEVTRAEVDDG